MSILIFGLAVAEVLALIAIVLISRSSFVTQQKHLRSTRLLLLSVAASSAVLLSVVALAAAAWGMNAQLPWGLGYWMYLTPVLSLPAFILLRFGTPRLLARALWLLTLASSVAFYFGDQAERSASGLPQAGVTQRLGAAANAFTLVCFGIALLAQMASVCATKEACLAEAS